MSDSHRQHELFNVPDGDVFIHAGDSCGRGLLYEFEEFCEWASILPHKHKIYVAGNHDWCLYRREERKKAEDMLENAGFIYLRDNALMIDGVKFYGMPWTPEFCGWAFMKDRNSDEMKNKVNAIHKDTEVLITHGPAQFILDKCPNGNVGCEILADKIEELNYHGFLKAHIFGHIHESHGHHGIHYNVAVLDGLYRQAHKCTIVEIQS